jgi:drug/metabolite transporter (DMT)-like permease
MTFMKKHIPIWPLLGIGIIAISFSSIFIRWSQAPVSVIAMYRLLLTDLLLLPALWAFWPSIRKLSAGDWHRLFWSGAALGLHFLFWMGSLRLTSVASSTALMTLEPVFVMIGSYFAFRHKTGVSAVLGVTVAVAGAFWMGWTDSGISSHALQGDLLSLLGTLAVAFHMLIGKSLRARMSAFIYSFSVFLIAAMMLGVYNIAANVPMSGYPAKEWGIFILLAVVPTLLGHYLFNWLLKYTSATNISMTVLGEPLGATILAYFLLQEPVTGLQIAAGCMLLVGVALFIRKERASH